mgnify:CR=1 FL=1
MSGKKYYKILNIPEGASKSEIKKSYRRLAKLYHPDVNNDIEAQEKFIQITEAYEMLINPTAKKIKKPKKKGNKRSEKWTKYQEQSRKKYAERVLRQEKEIQKFYTSLRKGWRRNWIRINVTIGIIICIFMSLDQYSSPLQKSLRIIHLKNFSEHNSITTNLGEFTLPEGHVSLRKKPKLTLHTTPYLNHDIYVTYLDGEIHRNTKVSYSPNGPSFYWGYPIIMIVSILPLFFLLFFRKNNGWFVFGHYTILIVTTPWLVYFILEHPNIIHIMTFNLF